MATKIALRVGSSYEDAGMAGPATITLKDEAGGWNWHCSFSTLLSALSRVKIIPLYETK